MKKKYSITTAVVLVILAGLMTACNSSSGSKKLPDSHSTWVYPGKDGKLVYKTTEQGDKIIDFSHAGYMGGGFAIPNVPVKVVVKPSGGDDTENIQQAIEKVSDLPLNGKFRGAVMLEPGEYIISGTLSISASGVVLRGSGSEGERKSTLKLTGEPFNAISIRLPRKRSDEGEKKQSRALQTAVTENYIPSGSLSFNVSDPAIFKEGDLVLIRKPVTQKWIEFMQMHDLVRDGKTQIWLSAGSDLIAERRIAKIEGNSIMLDVPLTDSYNADLLSPLGTIIEKIDPPSRISYSGVEKLHIISPLQPIKHSQPHFTAVRINGEDCWARNMMIEETMNSIGVGGKRITLERIIVKREALHMGSSRPAEFAPNGSQILVDRCKVIADNVWFVATGGRQSGPIVILNCEYIGDCRAESHQRWSTGMLYDNVQAPGGGIDFRNRGSMGSGHGWSMGWGVAWNCVAKDFVIQDPPGAHNWMIGCIGESEPKARPFDEAPNLPEGVKDSHGTHVVPKSLYLAQLEERLGPQALRNIGY